MKWLYDERKREYREISGIISRKKRRLWDQNRSCAEKKKYDAKTQAAQAARSRNRRVVIVFSEVAAYRCRHCCGWHIGHDNRHYNREKQSRYQRCLQEIVGMLQAA